MSVKLQIATATTATLAPASVPNEVEKSGQLKKGIASAAQSAFLRGRNTSKRGNRLTNHNYNKYMYF